MLERLVSNLLASEQKQQLERQKAGSSNGEDVPMGVGTNGNWLGIKLLLR